MESGKSGRIFEKNWLDRPSCAHAVLNKGVGLLLAGFCAAQVHFAPLGALSAIAVLASVVGAWTLIEYPLRRFLFQWRLKSAVVRHLYLMHAYHHDHPSDGAHILLPLMVSMSPAIIV